jgi:uroporphyrinogen-III synthase
MSILVTRPEPGASRTAEALAARGLESLAAPLFTIAETGAARPKGKFAALFVTSANGASGLTPASAELAADIPVYAVGDRTAEALRANGFEKVVSAAGDGKALAALALTELKPRWRLLLATGDDHKEALPQALTAAGYEVALWTRYRAEAVPALPAAAADGLREGRLTGVLHYSRRASETFLALAGAAGLAEQARALRHLALSEDVAAPLREAGIANVAVATQPDEAALLALLGPADTVGPVAAAAMVDPAPVASGALAEPVTVAVAAAPSPPAPATSLPGVVLRPLAADMPLEPVARGLSDPALTAAGAAPPPMVAATVSAPKPDEGGEGPTPSEPPSVTAAAPSEADQPTTTTPLPMAGAAVPGDSMADAEPRRPEPAPADAEPATPAPIAAPMAPQPPREPPPSAALSASSSAPPTRGVGMGGLLGVALAGGLLGATGITFLAPVLNQAGVRFPNSPTLAATDARLTRLEQTAPSAATPATAASDLAPLQAALAAAQARLADVTRQAEATQRELSALSARVAAAPPPSPAGAPAAALDGLRQELSQRLTTDIAAATGQAERARAAAETAAAAAQALAPRVTEAERLAQRATQAGAPVSAAGRLVMGERVQRALAEGRPFAQEARALAALGAAEEPMRALTALAATGAPPLAALGAELKALRQTAARTLTQEGPIADRVLAMLDGVVRVRAQGEAAGDGVLALFDRMEQALAKADPGAALAAFARLPEPVRQAGEALRARLSARAAADQAVKTILDDATKALAGAS